MLKYRIIVLFLLLLPKYGFTQVRAGIFTLSIIAEDQNTTTDSVIIHVIMENKSDTQFSVVQNKYIEYFNDSGEWNALIYYMDTIRFGKFQLINYRIPTKEDYIYIGNGKNYIFTFKIDFKNLVPLSKGSDLDPPIDYVKHLSQGKENEYYGEYTIQLLYENKIRKYKMFKPKIIRKALKGPIESNSIKVVYTKCNE